ncbi:MAG: PAS domain-containing protein [Pseudomonadota bacterium]|nr:PAS domain-containing protein [Pseudomonadota bacterium]
MNLFDQLPCAVLHTDHDGKIVQMNAELLHILGPASPVRPGALMDQLLPPASRIFLQTHVWPMLLREGAVREIYLHLRAGDATRIPVMVNASGGDGARGGYTWVMFVARERSLFEAELIKARNRAEAGALSLEGNDHFTHAIADLSGRALAFLDLSTRCKFSNARFAALLGEHHAHLDQRPWQALIEPGARSIHKQALEQALTGAAPSSAALVVTLTGRPAWSVRYLSSRSKAGILDGCFLVEQRQIAAP